MPRDSRRYCTFAGAVGADGRKGGIELDVAPRLQVREAGDLVHLAEDARIVAVCPEREAKLPAGVDYCAQECAAGEPIAR